MKIQLFPLIVNLVFISVLSTSGQDTKGRAVPSVTIKTLSGENFNTSKFSNDGKPMVIDFFATWCKPCLEELTAIHELYPEWQKENGVKVIAVSVLYMYIILFSICVNDFRVVMHSFLTVIKKV